MPVATTLERDGRIIVNTFTEPFDMAELAALQQEVFQEILNKATQRTYNIVDVTALTRLPSNALSNIRKITRVVHPMSGPTVIVSGSLFLRSMANALAQVSQGHVPGLLVCATLAEAYALIDQRLAAEKVTP